MPRLAAFVIRKENKTACIEVLKQHSTLGGLTLRIDGRQNDRVGFQQFSRCRLLVPSLKLRERAPIHVVDVE